MIEPSLSTLRALVIGALNIDLIATGFCCFPNAGEQVNGQNLILKPGGKARNIAVMLAAWLGRDCVSMVGKIIQDETNLWQIPLASLQQAGVNTDFLIKAKPQTDGFLPTFALIMQNTAAETQVYYLPGKNETLAPADIEQALRLWLALARNKGLAILTLETPPETVNFSLNLAKRLGIRTCLDPGGYPPNLPAPELDLDGLFLLKPNIKETAWLTGVDVIDFDSAEAAAQQLLSRGVEHVIITAGSQGLYAFNQQTAQHFPAAVVHPASQLDTTGCGDQVMAVLCAALSTGDEFTHAIQLAIKAAALQAQRIGAQPVLPNEITG